MKKAINYLAAASLLVMTSCGNNEVEETVVESVEASYTVNTTESVLNWEGKKLYNPEHKHAGTVMFSEGSITTVDGMVTAANFVVDLNTMVTTDSLPEEKKGYLIGHLKAADFFAVDSLGGNVTLSVTSLENNVLKGDLTVMGLSKAVEIPVNVAITAETITINGTFDVDMAQFGVKFLQQPAADAELSDEEKQNVYDPKVYFSVNVVANVNAAPATDETTEESK
jgi:polyisoprenoid-binding protein YceI